MELNQQLSQKQNLILSQSMKQSLQILNMSQFEISNIIKDELNQNPLLEIDENYECKCSEFINISQSAIKEFEDENAYINYSFYTSDNKTEAFFNYSTKSQTFKELLNEQIYGLKIDDEMQTICLYIIELLNRKGLLEYDVQEIATDFNIEIEKAREAVFIVQSLEPTGVAANSIEDCLILQLAQSKFFNEYTLKLVKDGLKFLAKKDIKSIMKLLQCSESIAIESCKQIYSLNPIPSSGYFTDDECQKIVPDAVVKLVDGKIEIIMNDNIIPKVIISQCYKTKMKNEDDKTKQYFKTKTNEAQALVNAVENRTNTLYKVIEYIVNTQKENIFAKSDLNAMSMNDVANALNISISTVSRAVNETYIYACNQIFDLHKFFTKAYQTEKGNISADLIKNNIKKLVLNENKQNPLSDEDMHKIFDTMNIDVSRRTIAKYRNELDIPNTCERRTN